MHYLPNVFRNSSLKDGVVRKHSSREPYWNLSYIYCTVPYMAHNAINHWLVSFQVMCHLDHNFCP